ncbi:hypothetical protein GJ496_009967 [Pomphorhynchus laevis]|nr:hypothetical protein GJ496_009967 [Pomphorhynchus laevis]
MSKHFDEELMDHFCFNGHILHIISEIWRPNNVSIYDGLAYSSELIQNSGVLQGDSLSFLLFSMYISDLPDIFKNESRKIPVILYADDLTILTASYDDVKWALSQLQLYCVKNKLTVNSTKTKIIKFRRGGRISATDRFFFNNKEINIVNKFKFLGLTETRK